MSGHQSSLSDAVSCGRKVTRTDGESGETGLPRARLGSRGGKATWTHPESGETGLPRARLGSCDRKATWTHAESGETGLPRVRLAPSSRLVCTCGGRLRRRSKEDGMGEAGEKLGMSAGMRSTRLVLHAVAHCDRRQWESETAAPILTFILLSHTHLFFWAQSSHASPRPFHAAACPPGH